MSANAFCLDFSTIMLFGNSLPDDKILDLSKFKAFADDKIIVTQKLKFTLGRIENIVGKGENAGYHFPTMFSKAFFSRGVTSRDCVVRVKGVKINFLAAIARKLIQAFIFIS